MDFCSKIRLLCEREIIPGNSKLFQQIWSDVQDSSSLTVGEPLSQIEWNYLMNILALADVSQIHHLVLHVPVFEGPLTDDLGTILGTGRFSALKTLRIFFTDANRGLWCEGWEVASLATALRNGKLENLRTLSLPPCDVTAILTALSEGPICQLRSLSIMSSLKLMKSGGLDVGLNATDENFLAIKLMNSGEVDVGLNVTYESFLVELDALLKSGCLKGLVHLNFSNNGLSSQGIHVSHVASLATTALRNGKLKNLRTLSLPPCDVTAILTALSEVPICQLRSLSIMNSFKLMNSGGLDVGLNATDENFLAIKLMNSGEVDVGLNATYESFLAELDALLNSGFLKGLVHLNFSNFILDGLDSWKVFTRGINSGLLPNIRSLCLSHSRLSSQVFHVDLTDLVGGPTNWFNSLENLVLDHCGITSEQLFVIVEAIMKVTETGSALKSLDLHGNDIGNSGVDALVKLANSQYLPQLQELNLSLNTRVDSKGLINFIETIVGGHLPSLRRLDWEGNPNNDAAMEALAQAYYENEDLTADINVDWVNVRDVSLGTKVTQYRDRNIRVTRLKEQVKEELQDEVPLTYAKVFLCGFPEVGKTKLRRTLQRHARFRTKFVWETHPNIWKERRTRGIELSFVEDKRYGEDHMTLVFWDLAGQEEYHVLHGTFLADLGFAGGKATTFVLVFRASFKIDVEEKLLYWLRFVASSSLQHVRRHVVIVLNCFHGKHCTESNKRLWIVLIKRFAEMFRDSIDICLQPFVFDVRVTALAKPLKEHLFNQARRLLQGVPVPRVCFELKEGLKGWSQGHKDKNLPIFSWQAFESGTKLEHKGKRLSSKSLNIVASYLHEMGEIIFLQRKESIESEPESESRNRSIVVPDPEWFCKQVVGELLLPKEMWEGDSHVTVGADGSISLILFQSFFEHLLVEGTQSDDVISMLELLGLCYRKGEEKIIVPALIRHDDYSSMDWEGKGFHGVLGRCVTTEDHEKGAIPLTLFRRLQVELAQDLNFGGRGDSGYRAGKSFSTFKVGELLVLIQFDVDHSDPTDDRLDILVKSLVQDKPGVMGLAQIKCICEIMQKVEVLCVSCCPGLRYDVKVIKPWNVTERTPTMNERKMMSLREIKNLLIQGKENSGWQLNKNPLQLKTFLSENELKEIFGIRSVTEIPDATLEAFEVKKASDVSSDVSLEVSIEQECYDDCRQDVVTMGLMTQASLQNLEESGEENSRNAQGLRMERALLNCGNNEVDRILFAIQDVKETVQGEGHLTRHYTNKRNEELLLEIRHKHGILVRHIQAQQAFSIEESERSVPRYMFLSKKKGQLRVWISLREAFQSAFELHLLCESHFDDGFLHEVEGQDGIELKKTKEWLVKVSPWLRRSLQVAIMVGKTVGNHYLPGFFDMIPDYKGVQDDKKAVDSAATMLLEEEKTVNQFQDVHENYGSATDPMYLKERLIAQEVLKDLINELGHAVFAKKMGLRKVLLRSTLEAEPQGGSSQQAQQSVLWICDDCFKKYGERATDISPRR